MTRRLALQMDPMASINPRTDTSLRLGIEAQARGYEVWVYTPEQLFYREGNVFARAQRVKLYDSTEHWFDAEAPELIDLKTMDVVWIRQDPPFNMAYITTTYLLESLHPKPFVVNHPASVRNYPEKWFPTELSQFIPPTLVTFDPSAVKAFRKEHKDVVVKPLYGHGGNSIFRFQEDDDNFSAFMEMLFAKKQDAWVVQKYLPEMKQDEVRIILIDGKYAGIAGRIPPAGETRAALRLGAKYIKVEPTRRQMEICEALGPLLKKRGLILTAIDVIGEWLTEINITSPSGIPPINALYGVKLEKDIWDAVERYIPA